MHHNNFKRNLNKSPYYFEQGFNICPFEQTKYKRLKLFGAFCKSKFMETKHLKSLVQYNFENKNRVAYYEIKNKIKDF